MEKEVARYKLAAKQHLGAIRAELFYHRSQKTAASSLTETYDKVQRCIAEGRSVQLGLSTWLQASGSDPEECPELTNLRGIIAEAITEQSNLYRLLFKEQKNGSLKSFKESIGDLIEGGGMPHWISTVTKQDIVNQGKEVNRLFQLLAEGTSAGALKVDSITLARAAERFDLFTLTQCSSLKARYKEVEQHTMDQAVLLARRLQGVEDATQLRDGLESMMASGGVESRQPSGWTCVKCTYHNRATEDSCGTCGAFHGPSFVAIVKKKPPTNNTLLKSSTKAVPPAGKVVWVKTPASRESKSTNTLWIRNAHVPQLIGNGGKNQRSLLAATGATNIFAIQTRLDNNGWCPVEILGNLDAFKKTAELIEKRLGHLIVPAPSKSVASNEGKQALKVVWIENRDVPVLIGPGGKDIKRFKADTGTTITACQERVDEDGLCPVYIKGSPASVKSAAAYIERTFDGILKDSKLTAHEPSHVAASFTNGRGSIANIPVAVIAKPNVASSQFISFSSSAPSVETSIEEDLSSAVDVPMSGPTMSVTIPHSSCSSDNTTMPAAIESTQGLTFHQHKTQRILEDKDPLLTLLCQHEKCITCTPSDFYAWLLSVDILSLAELADALDDEDFIKMEMKPNGFKYFKRFAIKKAIVVALEDKKKEAPPPVEPPSELICPIDHVLLTKDPVVARDGFTYERGAIERWFSQAIRTGVPICSPIDATELSDLDLIPNVCLRNLARDWSRQPSAS